ncbi:MAG TPA: SpoIID/LytB domain-containing protein [Armatimonadota bacterium]|jgi:stage II sporulation protein D
MIKSSTFQISPFAGAVAIACGITCLAILSGGAPERPWPKPGDSAVERPAPRIRLRPAAYHPRVDAFPAGAWLSAAPARAPQPMVRVLLSDVLQDGRLRITTTTGLLVIDPDTHRILARVPAEATYSLSLSDDGRAISGPGGKDLPAETVRLIPIGCDDQMNAGARQFTGALEVSLGKTGLDVVNEVREEDYIAGVVAGEAAKSFPLEALKAQAVAARTYALSQRGHRENGVDVLDTTADQVFTGAGRVWPECRAAVDATAGRILTYRGRPIVAYFSADCGGHTRTNTAAGLGGGPLPYLRAVEDAPASGPAYCAIAPMHTWSARLTDAEILPKLNETLGARLKSLSEIQVEGHYSDGRAGLVRLAGVADPEPSAMAAEADPARAPLAAPPAEPGADTAPQPQPVEPQPAEEPKPEAAPEPREWRETLRAMEFRKIVGLDALRSQTLSVKPDGPGAWLFEGRGYGHGVGMCQWGAAGMARQGISYDRILSHYYFGVHLLPAAPRDGALAGLVKDARGRLLPNAIVSLVGTDRRAKTNAKGRYRFPSVPAGTYDIVVTPRVGPAFASFAWTVNEGEETRARVIERP